MNSELKQALTALVITATVVTSAGITYESKMSASENNEKGRGEADLKPKIVMPNEEIVCDAYRVFVEKDNPMKYRDFLDKWRDRLHVKEEKQVFDFFFKSMTEMNEIVEKGAGQYPDRQAEFDTYRVQLSMLNRTATRQFYMILMAENPHLRAINTQRVK
ncbi:MAG: hypothetical protein LBU87_06310 [Lactobacillales bacterium]|jgi:hypothetical protein|nr:hypothetical protein [Lactobacillales bacterium]